MKRTCNPLLFTAALCVAIASETAMGTCTGDEVPGLVSRWRFRSEHVRDGSLKPVAGTLSGTIQGPIRFSEEPPEALMLDGRRNLVSLTNDTATHTLPRQEMTVEAWVQPDATPEWGGIVGLLQDNGDFEKGWLLGTRGRQFFFAVSTEGSDDGDGRLTYLFSQSEMEPGHWYHVVGTYDGKVQRIFVDGSARGRSQKQSGAINYPARGHYCIGAYHDQDELHRLTGGIGEVAVYRRALDAGEVAARFDADKSNYPLAEPRPITTTDWPTYLHDDARTGISPARLTLPLVPRWMHESAHPPRPAWPPPAKQDFWHEKSNLRSRVTYDRAYHVASVDGRVFYGSSADDKVCCLDQQTGGTLWEFFAQGPVRLAPCVSGGRVYFGSDDGCVYCLDAADGSLHWKFRAERGMRVIAGNGRLISALPVRSGVLVQDGQARFAAGLFPTQGAFQFVLDAANGKTLATGPLDFSPQGYMQRRGNQLYLSAGRSPQEFVTKLRRQGKGSGELLGTIPAEYPYAIIGTNGLRFAGGDGKIAALSAEDGSILWTAQVDGRAYGLAAAGGCLLVSTDSGRIYCFEEETNTNAPARSIVPQEIEPAVKTTAQQGDADDGFYAAAAEHIVATANLERGFCLVLGSRRGHLAEQLARLTEWTIVGIEEDAALVAASRNRLDRARLYGRVSIRHGATDELPFADSLIDVVVADGVLFTGRPCGTADEIARVLRPAGMAIIGRPDVAPADKTLTLDDLRRWLSGAATGAAWKLSGENGPWATFQRPPLEGAGQWTHMYANPANTACSGDRLVSDRLALQWFGRPGPRLMVDRHHRTVPPLSAGGRLFVPGNDHIFAVGAYNGTPLWDTAVPHFRRIGVMRDCGNMVATEDTLYALTEDSCLRFDARTGDPAARFRVPGESEDSPRNWGYLAAVENLLLGSATMPGASRGGHSKSTIEEGTYWDFRPIVTSRYLFALDRHEGDVRWRYEDNGGAIINPTITVGGGRVYFIESANAQSLRAADGRSTLEELLGSGAKLVALDLHSGKTKWKRPIDLRALKHHVFVVYTEEKLVIVGSRNQDTGKVDKEGRKIEHVYYDTRVARADDGKPLWSTTQDNHQPSGGSHGEQDHHPLIVGRTIYVEPYAYDLYTGRRREDWLLERGGHGCGTISASASTCFFRAGNPTMCDLATGQNTKVNTVSRPGCWINIVPAAGMLLIPEASSGCSCDFPLQTSMGFSAMPSGQSSN